MKKIILITLTSAFISLALIGKTVNLTVDYWGSALYAALTKAERDTISSLTITGDFNAADFRIMRDSMPTLKNIDLGSVNIKQYIGKYGTNKDIAGQTNTEAWDTIYGLNKVPQHAFRNNKTIRSVILPQSATVMGEFVFTQCYALQSVVLPPNITSLPNMTFSQDTSLTQITIPSQVTSIGIDAFYKCLSLSSITIPSAVTSIGDYAFEDCSGLKSIICKPYNPVDLSNTTYPFLDVKQNSCILYVPKGRTGQYQTTDKWRDFYHVEEDPTSDNRNTILDGLSICTQNGQVVLSYLPVGETLTIYTVQGSAIYSQTISKELVSVALPTQGLYILHIGNASRKFVY